MFLTGITTSPSAKLRNRVSATLLLFMFSSVSWLTASTPSPSSDNLISDEYFRPQLSWQGPERLWTTYPKLENFVVQDGICKLTPTAEGKRNHAGIPISIGYETAVEFELSLTYRSTGKNFLTFTFTHAEHRIEKGGYNEARLPESPEWTSYKRTFKRPPESYGISLQFFCDNGSLELQDLKVIPIDPQDSSGKPLILAGKKVETIWYREGFYNFWAAKLLRSQIFRLGGELLPMRVGEGPGINIGVVPTSAVKSGGCELTIRSGAADIAGLRPGGVALGAVELLKKLGVIYYTPLLFSIPTELSAAAGRVVVNPAIPMRYPSRLQCPELLGYTTSTEMAQYRKIGLYRAHGHSAPRFLPYDEFHTTHPEYYALQEDGLRRKSARGDVHFCMSNQEAIAIIAGRLAEFMRSEPNATYFPFFPGDGGNLHCRCEACAKMGANTGERNIAWVNAIARRLKDEFPDKIIPTYAYVDSRFPPQTIFPESNVLPVYCPYEPVWKNHLITDHPANAQGLADLAAWEKACPGQMAAFVYPSSCRERLNIWPAFYANYAKYKRFAENGYRSIEYCGMSPINGNGAIPAANNFCDLSIYVLGKVIIDPSTEVEKEIDRFMHFYYGADAATAMRRYFDLIHAEVVRRDWEQNTEKTVRGLVTPELARQGYACFAEAEAKASGDYLRRVRKEKMYLLWHDLTDNCRGNGRISAAELPEYSAKLAEFCTIAKNEGASYNTIPYNSWFWDTAILRLEEKGIWYNDPTVQELLKDPEQTLLKYTPRVQKSVPDGWYIENGGLLGGERSNTSWLAPESFWATFLRRPTSGLGTVQMVVELEIAPAGGAVLRIVGIDNEKTDQGDTVMELKVNSTVVYQGKVPWRKDSWDSADFTVPPGALVAGSNTIYLLNLTADTEVDGPGGANYVSSRNYYWGWFGIKEATVSLKK